MQCTINTVQAYTVIHFSLMLSNLLQLPIISLKDGVCSRLNSLTGRPTTVVTDFVAELRSVGQHGKTTLLYILCSSIVRAMMSDGKKLCLLFVVILLF